MQPHEEKAKNQDLIDENIEALNADDLSNIFEMVYVTS